MSTASGVGIDSEAARKIRDDGSEFKLPSAPREQLRQMSQEEWMNKYGDVIANERYFEAKDPNWPRNPNSWWNREVGRDGQAGAPPLWLQPSWHIPDLDCPVDGDRHTVPVDQRSGEDRPLWAERMGLKGNRIGAQSATIFGHRNEYLPALKSQARSMYERYQPLYQRVVSDELPDTSDPPDGRFWTSGVAQGVTTNPYEKRLSISGRRKPIVIGPRSISVVVDGEGHTLGNVVRDVSWLHPHVELAGYSLEHPVYRHVNMRIQTSPTSAVAAEQVLAESLELTKDIFSNISLAMKECMQEDKEKRMND